MDRDQFVTAVKDRAGLGSDDEAEAAIRATFETLAERIVGDETRHLAAQVPTELADGLDPRGREEGEAFPLEEFVSRVAERAGAGEADGMRLAQAVFDVTADAVTSGEMDDVAAQLPADYEPLLESAKDG